MVATALAEVVGFGSRTAAGGGWRKQLNARRASRDCAAARRGAWRCGWRPVALRHGARCPTSTSPPHPPAELKFPTPAATPSSQTRVHGVKTSRVGLAVWARHGCLLLVGCVLICLAEQSVGVCSSGQFWVYRWDGPFDELRQGTIVSTGKAASSSHRSIPRTPFAAFPGS